MDNDGVIESSHAIDQRARKGRSTNKGRDAAVAAGAIQEPHAYEETPLLSRDDTISEGSSDGGEAGNEGGEGGTPATEWPGTRVFEHLPWWKRPSVFWLLPSLLVHTLAFGGILVPKLTLILELVCRDYYADRALKDPNFVWTPVVFDGTNNPQCDEAIIQKLVSQFTLGMQLISGIMCMLVAPRLGALSDKYGRRRIIAYTGLGVFLNELTTILAAKYPETVSVNWLLFGSFLDGLSGTFITAMAVTNAYASDCTPPARRAVAFGWIHGCLFTGIALGPFLASIIIEITDSVLAVFYVALGVHAILLPYTYFVVPESLTKERQTEAREKGTAYKTGSVAPAMPFGADHAVLRFVWRTVTRPKDLLAPLAVLWPKGPGSSARLRRNLALLAGIDTILFGVAMGASTVIVYYSRFMFHWTPVQSSNFIATASLCRVFALLVFLPLITRFVRGKTDSRNPAPNTGSDRLDIWLISASVLLDALGFVGYASAYQGELFFLSGCVASFGGFGSAILQSSMTKHTPVEVTGQVLGANALLHGFARVVAPVVLNLIYAQTVEVWPRTVFVVLAAVFGLTFFLSLGLKSHVYLRVDDEEHTPDELLRSDVDNEIIG